METNRIFVNPYNFVPLGDGSKRICETSENSTITGEVVCTLKIKTPLAIPDTENNSTDKTNSKEYGFMSVDGKPIIPGSEIRGMIRNIYETITDSCLSVVNSNIITKRDNTPLKNPGLLFWDSESEKWSIWEAVRYNGKNAGDIEKMKKRLTAENIWFVERKWNPFSSKTTKTSLFYDAESKWYFVNDEIVENLINVLNSYIANNENTTRQYEAVMPKKDGSLYPVYYSLSRDSEEEVAIVLPAQISRSAYNKVTDMLGIYAPCEDLEKLCPGCSLFGTVTKNGAKASRLRFCDAVTVEDGTFKLNDNFTPLKILSSPHLNSTEFYSLKNGISMFTNVSRWEYNHKGVFLRGRKFYLHNPKAENDESIYSAEIAKSERGNALNASFKLATAGKFSFKIYFERISRSELQALIWSLTLGNAPGDETYCHKLGHGKPLGLGSVNISVEKIRERSILNGYSINEMDIGDLMNNYNPPISGTPAHTALLTICDYQYAENENIAYPLGESKKGEINSMHWFSLNHGAIGSRQPFKHVLHPVVDQSGNRYPASTLKLPYLAHAAKNTSGSTYKPHVQNQSNQVSKFTDKKINCKGCGNEFTWTAASQEKHHRNGWTSEPKWCFNCKNAKDKKG